MPEWPEPLPPLGTPRDLTAWHARAVAERNYEMDRADAAIARLRVAVEALREIADNPAHDNAYAREARDALDAIGPIPERT